MLENSFNVETDGYTVVVHPKNNPFEILCFADLVDRTVIVPNAKKQGAIEAANLLGGKRFIYNGDEIPVDAESFLRDRIMNTTESSEDERWTKPLSYLIGQEKVAESPLGRSPDFYNQLSILFSGAEFTPGKMEEYRSGEADKYCRVNGKYITPIVMLDSETGSMLGFIRIAIIEGCAYLSDEMIRPDFTKDSVEFSLLLGHLFNISKRVLAEQGISQVLIRTAKDRVELYETLGCKAASDTTIVPTFIQGPPTAEMTSLIKKALIQAEAAVLPKSGTYNTASSGMGGMTSAMQDNDPSLAHS